MSSIRVQFERAVLTTTTTTKYQASRLCPPSLPPSLPWSFAPPRPLMCTPLFPVAAPGDPDNPDRSTAAAVSSGSPNLGWLSQALVACRDSCPAASLSRVLAALLARLTAAKELVGQLGGGVGRVGTNALARRLLEQLLSPSRGTSTSSKSTSASTGRSAVGPAGEGGESLVRGLDPASTAALTQLQVYLICACISSTLIRYTD